MTAPDFLVIGARKAGTTTLFRWLEQHPDVCTPSRKEPNYYSGARWDLGPSWYEGLFSARRPSQIIGEASVSYSAPSTAAIAAERIAAHAPNVRLVFVARHPIDRLRSDYEHEVLRAREARPLSEAVTAAHSPYVRASCYFACLTPYVERFERSQLLVVRFEDLYGGEDDAWLRVLAHLGLESRPRPAERYNTSSPKPKFTKAMRWLFERGLVRRFERQFDRAPKPIRAIARRLLVRDDPDTSRRVDDAVAEPLPPDVIDRIERDATQLAEWLGESQPLWDLSTSAR